MSMAFATPVPGNCVIKRNISHARILCKDHRQVPRWKWRRVARVPPSAPLKRLHRGSRGDRISARASLNDDPDLVGPFLGKLSDKEKAEIEVGARVFR